MTKKSDAPAIRFKGFSDAWEQRKLSEITDKVTEKNAGLQYVETFTNSAEFGIISQRDFFDHDIAKLGSLDGYYIVKTEDFVYNPRISTSAPVGPINRNKLGRTGVMSPLYTVFRPHDIDTTYLEYFFKCGYWHSFMNFNGDSGARSDRFSIRDNVFFQMPIPIPDIDEQRKIGELLTCLDNLITLHQRKCALLFSPFQALISMMFTTSTFSWEQRKFSELVQIERGGSPRPIDDFITDAPNGLNWIKIGDAPTQGNYITKTAEKIRPEGLSKTREVHPGDLILSNSMSFGKPYIMGIDGCIHDGWLLIRNTYGVFDLTFLCHLLGTPQMLSQYRSLAAGSTVNNLNKELVGNTVVTIPSITEQRVLGDYLEQLDNLITLHQRKGKAAVTGCSNDANNSKGVYCKARDFGYKCYKKVKSQQIRCLIAVFIFFV